MKKTILYIIISLLPAYVLAVQPPPKRQMRGVWIATVTNIDFPSKDTLSVTQQKQELRTMLDRFAAMNINTVVFQARPAADAFFVSDKEPWSQWLTGKQGKAPATPFDPLDFLIREAHLRCMEAHVWINPYRASMGKNGFDKKHAFYRKKHLLKEYGGKYYFDPGLTETRQYLNEIVADIVSRYDVDAVHFDDYFYPYRVAGQDFPDDDTFRKEPRGLKTKDEWRRDNVNLIIGELQQTIKGLKPWVEFGISPFGVWRNADKDPRGSQTRAGLTNYDDLYADILLWLQEGTIDYVVPQLYWEIGKTVADYKILVDWWAKNSFGRNLYIGLYASGLGIQKGAWQNGNELARQLALNEKYPQQQGVFIYSARPFLNNPQGICDTLKKNYFKYPALVPINKNLNGEPSAPPDSLQFSNNILSWQKVRGFDGKEVSFYVVYAAEGEVDVNNPKHILAKTVDDCLDVSAFLKKKKNVTFAVTSVNRYKYESEPIYKHADDY
ncbi:MAG: family 10 glycosylhydrolase [Prevotellaceae bacterium]|nr:family 10 glycosylhydrolase [Prevotellaceae bacterium]